MNNNVSVVIKEIIRKTANNPEDLWWIINALRSCDGLDHIEYELKRHTVARLRGFLGFKEGNGFDVRSHPLEKWEQERRDILLVSLPIHFLMHWRGAVASVKSAYGYDLETESAVHD